MTSIQKKRHAKIDQNCDKKDAEILIAVDQNPHMGLRRVAEGTRAFKSIV